jgi:hypothetical protein
MMDGRYEQGGSSSQQQQASQQQTQQTQNDNSLTNLMMGLSQAYPDLNADPYSQRDLNDPYSSWFS